MKRLLFVCLALLFMTNFAYAGGNAAIPSDDEITEALSSPAAYSGSWTVNFAIDASIQQFRVTTAGTYLEIRVVDCCITGDQWVVRAINLNGGVQDVRGMGNGYSAGYSLPAPSSVIWDNPGVGRIWISKIGSSAIDAIVEFRASKSNAVSPSSAFARFVSNYNDLTVTPLTSNSTALPLPMAPLPFPSQ